MTCSVESQLREFASRGLSQRHSAQLLGINREKVRLVCQAIQPPIEWPGINQSIGSKLSYEGRRHAVTEKMAQAIHNSRKRYVIVEGHEITVPTVDKTTVWAVTTNGFTSGELQGRLLRYGAPTEAIKQGAATLLRRWKKTDNVAFRNGKWHWQGIK